MTLLSVQKRHLISLLGLSIALTFGAHAHAESPGAYYTFRNSGEKIHVPLVKAREYSSLCSGVLGLDDGIPVYVEPFENLKTNTEGCSAEGEFNGELGAFGGLGAKCTTKTAVRNDDYLDGGKTWADLLDLSALAAPTVSAASEGTAQKRFILKPAYRLGSTQQTQDGISNYLIMGLPLEGKTVDEKWEILTDVSRVCLDQLGEDPTKLLSDNPKKWKALEKISTNKYIVIDPNKTARSVFVFDSLAIPQLFFFRDQTAIAWEELVSENWANRIIEPGWLRSTGNFATVIVPKLSVWEARLKKPEGDAAPRATAIFSRDDRSRFVLQFKEPVADSDDDKFLHRRVTIPLPLTKNSEQAVEWIKKISVSLENDLDSIEPMATDKRTFDLLRGGSLDLFPEQSYDVAKNTAVCNELGATRGSDGKNKMFFSGISPLKAFGDDEYVFRIDNYSDKMFEAIQQLCARVQLLDDVDPNDVQGPTSNYPWIVGNEETRLNSVFLGGKGVAIDLGDGQDANAHEFLLSTVNPGESFKILRPGDEKPGVPPPAMKFILVQNQGSGAYYIQDFPITIHAALSYFRDPRFQNKMRLRTNFFDDQPYVEKCFFRVFHHATLVADQITFGTDLPLEEELLAIFTAYRLSTFLRDIEDEKFKVLFSPLDSRECLEAIFLGFVSVSDDKVRTEGLKWVKLVSFEEKGSSTSLGEELGPGESKLKERIISAMGLEFDGADAEEKKKKWMELDASEIEDQLREGQIDKTLSQVIDHAGMYFNKFRGSEVLPLALASGEDAVRFAHGLFRLPVSEDQTLQTQFTLADNQDWKLVPLSKSRVDALVEDKWIQYDRDGKIRGELGMDPSMSVRPMDDSKTTMFSTVETSNTLSAAERFELAIFDLLDGPAQEYSEGFHDAVLPVVSKLSRPEISWERFSSRLMIEPVLEKEGQ